MEICWIAVGILILQGISWWLIKKMTNMGPLRSGAISGWFSSTVGLYFLLEKISFPFLVFNKSIDVFFCYVIFATIFSFCVVVSKDNPSVYTKWYGKIFYWAPRVGIGAGLIVAALNQITV